MNNITLNNIVAIFKKEWGSYFSSPIGYVFIIFYSLVANSFFFFINNFFEAGQVTMRGYFSLLPWLFLFFVPSITMRLWSEEKRLGTIEFLLTSPITEAQITLGKFLASFCFLGVTLATSLSIPFSLSIIGNADGGVIIGSYIGALLMGAAYLSIGLYCSSFTSNQVVAFIISLAVILVLLLLGLVPVYLGSIGFLVDICNYLSLYTHFNNIARGVIDSKDLVYYTSVITLFLFLNIKHIQTRKWR